MRDDPNKAGLEQTAELLKTSSGLAAAILTVSVGLLGLNAAVPASAKWWLVGGWVLLGISVFASVVTFAVIPPKIADKDYALDDLWLNVTGGIHILTFLLGFVVLAIGVIFVRYYRPSVADDGVKSATDAVRIVRNNLAHALKRTNVQTVELIHGDEANDLRLLTWHVKVVVRSADLVGRMTPAIARPAPTLRSIDFFID